MDYHDAWEMVFKRYEGNTIKILDDPNQSHDRASSCGKYTDVRRRLAKFFGLIVIATSPLLSDVNRSMGPCSNEIRAILK